MLRQLVVALICLTSLRGLYANPGDGRMDIYFIDVEGGAASLIVTPEGESLLVDSGMADPTNRDLDRVLHVIQKVAQLDHLDHALVTHWHIDHFGNHAALAGKIKIRHFWDRGIPDTLMEDPNFPQSAANYRAVSQNQSKALKAGEMLPLKSGKTPLKVKVVTASGEVIPNAGEPNPFAAEHKPQPEDTSDNAKSVSLFLTFGKFKYLCCGDLTWNTEAKLMTPNNPLGQVDLFMVTHHGLDVSNNPVLVWAIDPLVTVTCNGPVKGAGPVTNATLKKVKSLQAMYQLHRNIKLADADQAPSSNIANFEDSVRCKGNWIKVAVAPEGSTFSVQVGPDGKPREFQSR